VEQVVDISFIKMMSDEVGQVTQETYDTGQQNNAGTVVEANFNINFDSVG
jgi:hypothetical protein